VDEEDELDKMVDDILNENDAKKAAVAPVSNGDYMVG
jgi:hypothetical protein